MFRKAKKLIVCYWIIRLQFFPIAMVTGGEAHFDVMFPPETININPGKLSYQFQPIGHAEDKDSLRRIIRKEMVKYGMAFLPFTTIHIVGSITDLNDMRKGSTDAIAGRFPRDPPIMRFTWKQENI